MEFLIFLVHLHSMVTGQRLDVSYGTVAHELAVIDIKAVCKQVLNLNLTV